MTAAAARWVIAGGGTGGHVTPALALAERIAARGDSLCLMGSERGLETRLVPEAGFELVLLRSGQIMGRGVLGRIGAIFAMAWGVVTAWRELGARRAEIVISVGGYASVPAVLAAVLRLLPVALVEPNARPGRSNRATARFARGVFVQFEEAIAALGRDRKRVQVVGSTHTKTDCKWQVGVLANFTDVVLKFFTPTSFMPGDTHTRDHVNHAT